ncbi:MAG: L,D-transpeptidase [Gemmatimonadetes bacterium]|nr:L,D-transpeptidase [Gemmatimonadota bacterium]
MKATKGVLRCLSGAALLAAFASAAAAQLPAPPPSVGLPPDEPLFLEPPLHTRERYVLVQLAQNRLYLLEGNRAVWSAPVATGTGFRLEGKGRSWHFATPRGLFRVQRKEKDPIWIKPDWAFIEEGLPVPPLGSPLRRQVGMLGTTAIYIGYELAMHGTSKPELVLQSNPEDRRVSHGCIRLTNEDARTLYHLVEVGTPVLIY